jgi:hypothetical protein
MMNQSMMMHGIKKVTCKDNLHDSFVSTEYCFQDEEGNSVTVVVFGDGQQPVHLTILMTKDWRSQPA